jgi:hypothetical protein
MSEKEAPPYGNRIYLQGRLYGKNEIGMGTKSVGLLDEASRRRRTEKVKKFGQIGKT